MTLFSLFSEGEQALFDAGIPDAQVDARELLLASFDLDLTHYLLERLRALPEDEKTAAAAACYRRNISARAAHVPLQQLLGRAEFMGLSFFVNEQVLIPRQDTETLAELALARCGGRAEKKRLLDLCTGSGCLAVSLAVKGGFGRVDAADLSAEALEVAKKNARALCAGYAVTEAAGEPCAGPVFRLLRGDLFGALPSGEAGYDVIVSNPPYIATETVAELSPEVRDHEPAAALDGGADGLCFYRRIAAEAGGHLVPGGALFLEIGFDQGEAVRALLEDAGFREVTVYPDLAGHDRVVYAEWPGEADGRRKKNV